jgi:FAD synthase
MLPFREIRTMPPEEFVAVVARELGASGVVAGRNYRFGAAQVFRALGFT